MQFDGLISLIRHFGKEKINTLTKYPSILTLHGLGEKGCLTNELTTPIKGEKMFATEKIDGTNVRIITFGDEYLIGSRDRILHYSNDLYYSTDLDIVDSINNLDVPIPYTSKLTIYFGELYGGKIQNAQNYGREKTGFRLFDIVEFDSNELLNILAQDLSAISRWREHETENGLVYGQNFLSKDEIKFNQQEFLVVPEVEFDCGDYSHETILANLKKFMPETKAALTENAKKKPEGVILRNANRTKIVKVRFEDYERTLKNKK